MTDERPWWQAHGYLAGKQVDGGAWVVLMPMITTYRLAVCTEDHVMDFYCYPVEDGLAPALEAFAAWDGKTADPQPGWVKHHATGRRRNRLHNHARRQLALLRRDLEQMEFPPPPGNVHGRPVGHDGPTTAATPFLRSLMAIEATIDDHERWARRFDDAP